VLAEILQRRLDEAGVEEHRSETRHYRTCSTKSG
jgi:hypothetical protein